jgi:signal transduction histidine kinase
MKDRLSLAGGTMKIENRNGGTRVTAELRTMKAAS